MYRMRVVNFDKVVSEKEINIEKCTRKQRRHHDRKIRHKSVSTQKSMKTERPKAHNIATNTERQVIKKCTGFSSAKKISLTSISDQCRLRTKGIFLKSLSSIKTISWDDIRKTLINKIYCNRRQKKPKQNQKNNAVKRCVESQDDIKILYSFERSISPEDGRTGKNSSKTNFSIRRSSSDTFGIGSACKNKYLCFRTSKNICGLFPTQKRRMKTKSIPCILQQVKIPSRSKKLTFQRDSSRDHYNVVCFPKLSRLSAGSSQLKDGSTLKFNEHHHARAHNSYLLKDHDSPKAKKLDSSGDAENLCVCEVVAKQIKSSDILIKKIQVQRKQKKVSCFCWWDRFLLKIRTCCRKLKSGLICIKSFLLKMLKYVLIALTVIAWSPCILVVALCWLLVYPLKPHYVLGDDKRSEQLVTCCTSTKLITPTKRKRVCTRALECAIRTSQRILSIIYKFYASLFNKKLGNSQTSSPTQITKISPKDAKKWTPKPGKKYILFYDKKRGWLMKPLRNETCDECRRPEVVQNLRLNRKSSSRSKNKAVTFLNEKQEEKHKCDCPPNPFAFDTSSRAGKTTNAAATITSSNKDTQTKCLSTPSCKFLPGDRFFTSMDKKAAKKKGIQGSIPSDDIVYLPINEKAARKMIEQGIIPKDINVAPTDPKDERKKTKQGLIPSVMSFAGMDKKSERKKTKPEIIPSDMNVETDKKSAKRGRFSSMTRPSVIRPKICIPCPKRKELLEKRERERARAKEERKKEKSRHPPIHRTIVRPCARRPHVNLKSRPGIKSKSNSKLKSKSKGAVQNVKDKEPQLSMGQRFCESCKSCGTSLKQLVCEAEKTWDVGINCNSIYIQTLRKRPCIWIYHCCESIYPAFLAFHKACCNLCYILMLMVTLIVWLPCFCLCYLFCTLVCGGNS